MRARVVIGASFGDEGKGLVTDYLCSVQGAGVVVRFNGGAQAGHTVVTPDGCRHVFQHVGAGAFCDVPTFLSEYFVVNPLMFFKELDALHALGVHPQVFASPGCPVTTFADMMINQRKEDARGANRHGSVGLGVHETMQRSQVAELSITMADLWNGNPRSLMAKLGAICDKWARYRTGAPIADAEAMIESFVHGCEMFASVVHPAGIGQCKDPVFEGAQGLLLDQDRKDFWPHVTHSRTGMHNVRKLCAAAGIDQIDAYYVSRTYLTRHGAGPLPGEDAALSYPDATNVEHPYQGGLRFAPLDAGALLKRCADDFGSADFNLVLTHCDQRPAPVDSALRSYGPTRADVERTA
jgi:adenylosuccinate synthase